MRQTLLAARSDVVPECVAGARSTASHHACRNSRQSLACNSGDGITMPSLPNCEIVPSYGQSPWPTWYGS